MVFTYIPIYFSFDIPYTSIGVRHVQRTFTSLGFLYGTKGILSADHNKGGMG